MAAWIYHAKRAMLARTSRTSFETARRSARAALVRHTRGSFVAINSDDFVTDLQRRYMSRCRGVENAYLRPPSTMPARPPTTGVTTTGIGEGGAAGEILQD